MFPVRGWADPAAVEALHAPLARARCRPAASSARARRRLPRCRVRRHRGAPAVPLAADRLGHAAAVAEHRAQLSRRRRSSALGRRAHLRGARIPHRRRARGRAGNPDAGRADRHLRPSPRDRADIERGLALLAAMGPFDIGQAAVVAANHVLAVEAAEGTDAMLARIADLRARGRIAAPSGTGVLVKAPKPRPGPALRSAGDRTPHGRGSGPRGTCRNRRGRGVARSSPSRPRSARRPTRRRSSSSASAATASREQAAISGGGRGVRRCARRRADGGTAHARSRGDLRGRRRARHDGAGTRQPVFDR